MYIDMCMCVDSVALLAVLSQQKWIDFNDIHTHHETPVVGVQLLVFSTDDVVYYK